MIRLVDLYEGDHIREGALEFLYELMKERDPEINISHSALPTFEQHRQFVTRRPYRFWFLIEAEPQGPRDGLGAGITFEPVCVGYVSATHHNEIGVVLGKAWRGRRYGPAAILQMLALHEPLTAEAGVRTGRWVANIAPQNEHSKHVFEKLGFKKIQSTYAL